MAIGVYRPLKSFIASGGTAVAVLPGPMLGGLIVNPYNASDQGIGQAEPLYVDPTGFPAALGQTATTVELLPGQGYVVPANCVTDVTANAATSGHSFSAYLLQTPPSFPPAPQKGNFPPAGPTTMTQAIPAYVYQEYNDDEDVQSLFGAQNSIAQGYVDWFVGTPLGAYTNGAIAGPLLDLVGTGLYGVRRPTLNSRSLFSRIGTLNTYAPNTLALNTTESPQQLFPAAPVNDDVYKRVITWNFYKGDGNRFSSRWLKRRIMRFLIGTNGSAPNIDNTYPISVTWGDNRIDIRINPGTRVATGGALCNRFAPNTMALNALVSFYIPGPSPLPMAATFKEAMDSGVLQMPFQYGVTVLVGGG